MIDAIKYIFSEVYTLDAVDVVAAATPDALRMHVNIVQNVSRKVAVIPHIPITSGSSRGIVTLLYMHKPSSNNLGNSYDVVIDMTPEDIIQQY